MLLGAECHPVSLLLSAVNHVGFHSPGLGVSSAQYVVLNGVVGQSVTFVLISWAVLGYRLIKKNDDADHPPGCLPNREISKCLTV
ncbi:hypothetical protein AAFF_G00395390 [Aldrovandia affinis]|uniref:Uncharacterized protein n=1 Tax=Aldrovandia affinis TaxID=143900 RepID=A0AAD7VZ67_9TELE|nr:hypothetical protein AAFF_G00395390 [Aldrovandia affinis]